MTPNKRIRLLYVMEAMDRLKVATPRDILTQLSQQFNLSEEDANFKRSIYRDLKNLAEQGKLHVRTLAADGVELPPEEWDESKNIRLEYSIHGQESSFVGIGLIEEMGAQIILPQKRKLNFRVSSLHKANLERNLNLIFKGHLGKILTLQLPQEDFPARLLILRSHHEETDHKRFIAEIEERFGFRTAVLFVPDPTVSRYQAGVRAGHALITIDHKRVLTVSDFASSSGSKWSNLDKSEIEALLNTQQSKSTIAPSESPLENEGLVMQDFSNEVTLSNNTIVNFGKFRILIVISEK